MNFDKDSKSRIFFGGEGGGAGGVGQGKKWGGGREVSAKLLISDTLYTSSLYTLLKILAIAVVTQRVYVNSSYLKSTSLIVRNCLLKKINIVYLN